MKLGLIGTGAIGMPMALRIVEGGIPLSFYARRPEAIERLEKAGATFLEKSALGKECDTVLLIVNTFSQCMDCVQSLLKEMQGGVIAVCSTIAPAEAKMLENLCLESGTAVVSAPVTGGVANAEIGKLTVITSGRKERVDALAPVFRCFASKLVYAGKEVEQAAAMKLLIQRLVGIHCAAAAETLVLGAKCGLDPELIYDTVCASSGVSRMFELRAKAMIERDFSARGTIDILHKDLKYAAGMADEKGCSVPLGKAAFDLFQIAEDTLPDTHEDFSAVIKVYERWSGITVEKQSGE